MQNVRDETVDFQDDAVVIGTDPELSETGIPQRYTAATLEEQAPGQFKIYRKRYVLDTPIGPRFTTFIRIIPDPESLYGIYRGQLQSCEVQTSESFNLTRAFNFQLNRIRDRWHIGIKRSTGYVLLDAISAVFKGLISGFGLAIRAFIGTKTRFSDLLDGAEFRCKTIEEQKETEVLVFASIAAIIRAGRFAAQNSSEVLYIGEEFLEEIKGLTFAGGMAGTMSPDGDAEEDDGDADDDEDEDDLDADDIDIDTGDF